MKKYIWIIIVAALVIAAFIWYKKKNKKPASSQPNSSPTKPGLKVLNLSESNFPLATGSKGRQVLMLQAYVAQKYGSSITLDGVYGQMTYTVLYALKKIGPVVTKEEYDTIIKPIESKLISYLAYRNIEIASERINLL